MKKSNILNNIELSSNELHLLQMVFQTVNRHLGNSDFVARTGFSLNNKILERISTEKSDIKTISAEEIDFLCCLLNVFDNDFKYITQKSDFNFKERNVENLLKRLVDLRTSIYGKAKISQYKKYSLLETEGIFVYALVWLPDVNETDLNQSKLYFSLGISPKTDKRFYVSETQKVLISFEILEKDVKEIISFLQKNIDFNSKMNSPGQSIFYGYDNLYCIKFQLNPETSLPELGSDECFVQIMCRSHFIADTSNRSYMGGLSVMTTDNIRESIQFLKELLRQIQKLKNNDSENKIVDK